MSTPDELARNPEPSALTRAQEQAHVQERLSEGAPGAVSALPAPPASTKPAAPAPLRATTGGGSARVAAALWLASSLLALVAAALFVLPEARRRLSSEAELITYSPSPTPAPPLPGAPGSVATEVASPFQGFVLVVESVPPGAHVSFNGEDQGQAPVSTGLDCAPGTPVRIELSLHGFERAQHVTPCREDTLLKVSARLKRSRPAGTPGEGR